MLKHVPIHKCGHVMYMYCYRRIFSVKNRHVIPINSVTWKETISRKKGSMCKSVRSKERDGGELKTKIYINYGEYKEKRWNEKKTGRMKPHRISG